MKKIIIRVVVALCILGLCVGCGSMNDLNGEWLLTQNIMEDGTIVERNPKVQETMKIDGKKVLYKNPNLGDKVPETEMTVEKNEDGTYTFKRIDKDHPNIVVVFMENVVLEGDTLKYSFNGNTIVFTKQN